MNKWRNAMSGQVNTQQSGKSGQMHWWPNLFVKWPSELIAKFKKWPSAIMNYSVYKVAKWILSKTNKVAKCNYDQICLFYGQVQCVNGPVKWVEKWILRKVQVVKYNIERIRPWSSFANKWPNTISGIVRNPSGR